MIYTSTCAHTANLLNLSSKIPIHETVDPRRFSGVIPAIKPQMPYPLSHKCPIPMSPLCLTSHFMCVQIYYMVNIDLPAGAGAPPLDKPLLFN